MPTSPSLGSSTYAGFTTPDFGSLLGSQKSGMGSLLGGQDASTSQWLKNYSGAIGGQETMPAMYERLSTELGLPALRNNAFNLQSTLESIPQTYKGATRGFDVNQNQLSRIVGTKTAQLAPLAQRATAQQQQAEGLMGTQMGLAQQQQAKELTPYTYEKEFLTDRAARETSLFSQQSENELQALTAKMQAGIQLTEAEKNRAQELEIQRRNYENQKSLASQQFGYDKELTGMKLASANANDPLSLF